MREEKYEAPNAAAQIQLLHAYQRMRDKFPLLQDVGFKVYSQADEDGILLYILGIVGTGSKRCVEICAGDGLECNTANLIINHGWDGFLVDGDARLVERGRDYYRRSRQTYVYPPTFEHAWIARETVNDLLARHGFDRDIQVLSIDLDGVDYWIWEALKIEPPVVVVEYNTMLGPDLSVTVPYDPKFDAGKFLHIGTTPVFISASLAAYAKLGKRRGYRLVGVNRYGYNAFFVKQGIAEGALPAVSPGDCFGHAKARAEWRHLPQVRAANLPWVEV
jgi:hypothetical protein